MNHDESTIDSALTRDLRDALSELATPGRPPLAAITGRGRVHRRRRLAGFAGLGVTAAVVGTAIALGLTGALGVTQAPNTDAIHAGVPTRHRGANPGTVRTAAFVLTSNTNGTDTLTLTMSQTLNPATLQQALAQHGIPALVKTGTICSSNPAPPNPVNIGVFSIQPPTGVPHAAVPAPSGPPPSELNQIAARTVTVINPAAIPSGTELFFSYSISDQALFFDLINTSSYTCTSQ